MDRNNCTYKKFMHTWKTKDNKQHVWDKIIENEIDHSEYELLNPDFYTIDEQEDFINAANISNESQSLPQPEQSQPLKGIY